MTGLPDLARRVRGALPLSLRRRAMYYRKYRRPLRLHHPVAFSEKVNWRIVYDRRELLAVTCDKLAMKEFALARVPSLRVPATLWTGRDVRSAAGLDLPPRWVLKPNHRFGLVHFGRDAAIPAELVPVVAGWLEETQASQAGEWAYSRARRLLLIEEFVGRGGQVPVDYKFFVFDGVPHLVQVDTGRYDSHLEDGHRQRLYTPDWTPLPYTMNYPVGPVEDPPSSYQRMLDVAAALGEGYDFLRVDLYDLDGEVAFGEITPYPSGGRAVRFPREADEALGQHWRLPPRWDVSRERV